MVFVPVDVCSFYIVIAEIIDMSCVHLKDTLESILKASRISTYRKAKLDVAPFRFGDCLTQTMQ